MLGKNGEIHIRILPISINLWHPKPFSPQKKCHQKTVSDCYFFHPRDVDISERHPAQKKWGYNGVCGFMSREGWKIFPELTSFIMDIYIYMKTINTWQFCKRAMFGGMVT